MTQFYFRTVKAFALTALALSSAFSLSAQSCNKTLTSNSAPTGLVIGDVLCIQVNNFSTSFSVPSGVTVVISNNTSVKNATITIQGSGTLVIASGGSISKTGTSVDVQSGGTLDVLSGGSFLGGVTVETGGTAIKEAGATWNPSSNSGNITILPIILQSFTATANGNVADIRWTTASELNGRSMTVQHSVDGTNFEDIKTVATAINSSLIQNYSYTDYNALNGINYYRLKLVSSDAPVSYSAVVAVKISGAASSSVAVYPTAFTDHFTVKLNDVKSGSVIAKLYNDQGVVVLVQTLTGSATQVINTPANLATGLYILEVINGTEKSFSRLVKL
jgi:hypothetical protein